MKKSPTSRSHSGNSSAASKMTQIDPLLKLAGTGLGLVMLFIGLSMVLSGLGDIVVDKNPVDFSTHDLNYFWSTYFNPANQLAHRHFVNGVALIGAAVGIMGLAWGWFDSFSPRTAIKPGVFYGTAAGLMVVIVLFILRYGMCQFGGNDQSCLIDPGWRLMNGQTPNVDFPCTFPVGFVLGAKFALQWFGVFWRSFIVFNALFAVVTFAWSVFLLTELFGRTWSTLLWASGIQALTTMLASYWWYNTALAVAAVLYMLSALYWLRCPARKSAVVSYAAALLFMATMKPNVAGILIPGISVVLFLSHNHRWKVLLLSLGVFAIFILFLSLNRFSFPQMVAGYLSIASRGGSASQFLQDMNPVEQRVAMMAVASALLPAVLALGQGPRSLRSAVSWLPAIALVVGLCVFMTHLEQKRLGEAVLFLPVVLALCLCGRKLRSLGLWIAVIALLGGLYGYFTNGENKLVDLSSVFIASILVVAQLRSRDVSEETPVFAIPLWWNRYIAMACAVLAAAGLGDGISRHRIEAIGPVAFFEWDGSKYTIADGFFKGLRCGEVFNETLKDIGDALRRQPSTNVWFGPRMQFGYAAFDRQSPLNEPLNWDHGQTMYAASKEEYYFSNFLQNRHELLFLPKNDAYMFTQEQIQRILQRYSVDQSYPFLTVLHLKKESADK